MVIPLSPEVPLMKLITNPRTCPEVQPWLYGYDATKEVEEAINKAAGLFSGNASVTNRVARIISRFSSMIKKILSHLGFR